MSREETHALFALSLFVTPAQAGAYSSFWQARHQMMYIGVCANNGLGWIPARHGAAVQTKMPGTTVLRLAR